MRRTSGQVSAATESDSAPMQADLTSDPIGLAAAIASGVIREQDLITVLTEMCRCLLVERRTRLEESTHAPAGPPSKRA